MPVKRGKDRMIHRKMNIAKDDGITERINMNIELKCQLCREIITDFGPIDVKPKLTLYLDPDLACQGCSNRAAQKRIMKRLLHCEKILDDLWGKLNRWREGCE